MEEKLKKYFLGTLSEAEIEQIDLQLIADADFEEDLLLAKNNLMEDYLEDSLSLEENEAFQQNFLVTEERKKEFENLALLINYVQNRRRSDKTAGEQKATSPGDFIEKLNKFFTINLRPLALGFAALFIAAFLIGYAFYYNSSESELAELNRQNFEKVENYRNLTNLNLIAGTLRGSNGTVRLSADKLTDPVFLRLALPVKNSNFKVNIFRNEEKIVSDLQIRPYSNQSGQELRLILPVSYLTKGSYKIEAAPMDSDASPFVYSFTVQ